MRNIAIEYPEQGKIRFVDIGEPREPRDTEIVIETCYTGITNGTERHALLGEHLWKGAFPSKHGYQHVGRVHAAGSAVKHFQVGDWVFFGGYIGHHGWVIQDVASADVESHDSHLCIKLPSDVNPQECALFGVAGVALRGVRRFRVGPGDKVWVIGMGPIGQFSAQAARAVGAHVTVSDVDDKRLAIAKECGAHRVLNAKQSDYWDAVKAGGPYDCIIECSGAKGILEKVFELRLNNYRGIIGLMAVRTETVFHWSMLHTLEGSIEVSCHFSVKDLAILIHFLQQGLLRVGPVISHRAPVTEAIGIYEALRDRPGDLLGVVFDWT